LRVPAGQHYLEFKFTALSLTAPDKVRFKWRLLGLEHDWKAGGEVRAVSYPFLPPGEYKFEVQACNNDGVWNEAGAAVALTVLPFFWQTWWFKLVSAIIAVLLLLGAVLSAQKRRHRTQMQILERQHALEKERTRIARDIHDQVGANLTKIGRLGEFLDRQSAVAEPHKPVLQTMADTTREIVRTMDEIVWAVNPRNDTLENVVNYLVHYSEEFLGSSGVACTLDVPLVFSSRPVSAEVRHNLFMAVREALNNSIKHGHPTRVHVQLAVTEDKLTVCLEDDGRGFDPASPAAGRNGLVNMRNRLESVGGRFELASGPARGTCIHMSVPVHHA
jgi:signal transduction histidine kinase